MRGIWSCTSSLLLLALTAAPTPPLLPRCLSLLVGSRARTPLAAALREHQHVADAKRIKKRRRRIGKEAREDRKEEKRIGNEEEEDREEAKEDREEAKEDRKEAKEDTLPTVRQETAFL
eukprot:2220028-Rhodomonas_salina.3